MYDRKFVPSTHTDFSATSEHLLGNTKTSIDIFSDLPACHFNISGEVKKMTRHLRKIISELFFASALSFPDICFQQIITGFIVIVFGTMLKIRPAKIFILRVERIKLSTGAKHRSHRRGKTDHTHQGCAASMRCIPPVSGSITTLVVYFLLNNSPPKCSMRPN